LQPAAQQRCTCCASCAMHAAHTHAFLTWLWAMCVRQYLKHVSMHPRLNPSPSNSTE
jgi:hypothetical protein